VVSLSLGAQKNFPLTLAARRIHEIPSNKDETENKGKRRRGAVQKEMSKAWKALEDKSKWVKLADEDKERFEKETAQ
jgi:hypothetical protein